jgi:hypothetical protein
MINWKELEKFVAPGKVVTLVIMVDGKELGALSFNVDTLAYKEILEVAKTVETFMIADKPEKKTEPAKTTKKSAPVKEKIEPEVMDDDPEEEEEEIEEDDEVTEKAEVSTPKDMIKKDHIQSELSTKEPVKMTRDQIMAATAKDVPPAEVKKEEPVKPLTLSEEW